MRSVALTEDMHSKLKAIKVHKRESFSDVIKRLYNERIDDK